MKKLMSSILAIITFHMLYFNNFLRFDLQKWHKSNTSMTSTQKYQYQED